MKKGSCLDLGMVVSVFISYYIKGKLNCDICSIFVSGNFWGGGFKKNFFIFLETSSTWSQTINKSSKEGGKQLQHFMLFRLYVKAEV